MNQVEMETVKVHIVLGHEDEMKPRPAKVSFQRVTERADAKGAIFATHFVIMFKQRC